MTIIIAAAYVVVGALCLWLLIRWVNRKNTQLEAYVPEHYEPRKTPTPPPIVKTSTPNAKPSNEND